MVSGKLFFGWQGATSIAPTAIPPLYRPPIVGSKRRRDLEYSMTSPIRCRGRGAVTGVLDDWCGRLPGAHHSLSLTGGEPLLHAEALADWAPYLAERLPLFLETNGTLPEALSLLLPDLSWISMDIKLASVSGVATPWSEHRAFLELSGKKCCQVKVVVASTTPPSELVAVAELVHEVASQVPLILQPLTLNRGLGILPQQLLSLELAARRVHNRVKVIPQMHPLLGVL